MNFQEWIKGIILCSVICGSAMFFVSGQVSAGTKNAVKFLCGVVMTAVTLLPFAGIVKNYGSYIEKLYINFNFDNIIKVDGQELAQELVTDTAEKMLEERLTLELRNRLGREDFSLSVYSEGYVDILYDTESDFPGAEARLITSALLGGCTVNLYGGFENEG